MQILKAKWFASLSSGEEIHTLGGTLMRVTMMQVESGVVNPHCYNFEAYINHESVKGFVDFKTKKGHYKSKEDQPMITWFNI